MIQKALNASITLVMGTCLLLASCGKKAENDDKSQNVITAPGQTAVDTFMEKQDVSCEQSQACPSFITKIVTVEDDKFKFCTGFLIDKDLVATSTSCLPNLMKLVGSDCSKDIFFFFPKSGNRQAERGFCSRVLQVSQLDGIEPGLWRDDLAILQLSKPIAGRKANYVRKGVVNNKEYYSYMIDQQGEFSAIVKRLSCNAVHANYLNPLGANESSPNVTFAGCPMTNGGSGAPLLDTAGKVRALVSVSVLASLREYLLNSGLLTNGLQEMVHATNLACAPILNDLDMTDEKECLKDLTELKVNKLRADMLSPKKLFEAFQKRLEASLDKVSDYVHFGVKLIPNGDIQNTEIFPKCFKPLENWLPGIREDKTHTVDIKLPVTSFKRSMDNVGRIQGITLEKDPIKYKMQYSPRLLRNSQYSAIFIFTQGPDSVSNKYPDITPVCPKPEENQTGLLL